jgi:hypothetical protein
MIHGDKFWILHWTNEKGKKGRRVGNIKRDAILYDIT